MLTIVRNSLIAVIASLIFLSIPLVFPSADEAVRNVALAVILAFALALVFIEVYAVIAGKPAPFWTTYPTLLAMMPVLIFTITYDVALHFCFGGIVAAMTAVLTWLHVTRNERAVKRAERRSAREAEEKEQARLGGIGTALTDVPSVWLLDALGVPEKTSARDLIVTVGDLPEGAEYALVRAHRKGVTPNAVTPFVKAGVFTEADADLLAGEVA